MQQAVLSNYEVIPQGGETISLVHWRFRFENESVVLASTPSVTEIPDCDNNSHYRVLPQVKYTF